MRSGSGEVAFRERSYSARDGLQLYYREYGPRLDRRLPLLCLTGLARNSRDYHPLASRLAAERRVVCPDYRGRGRSARDPDWRHYRAETCARDIQDLVILASLHPVVVCGTSMGGFLAMGLAVLAPSSLAGIVLNDVGPDIPEEAVRRVRRFLEACTPQPDLGTAAQHLSRIIPELGLGSEEAWRLFAEATYRKGDDGRFHADWDPSIVRVLEAEGPSRAELWRLFGAISGLPVLVVRGANSDILTAATLEAMQEAHPGLEAVTVPDKGHAPTLVEPPALAALEGFLARLDSSASNHRGTTERQ